MEDLVHVEKVSPKPLMFSIADLERKFWGKTGIVVQIDEDTVVVHNKSSQCQFTVAIDSLVTFIRDFAKKDTANVTTNIETPMKGDHVIVTESFYICEFWEVSGVDIKTKKLMFFSESQQLHITVPIRMTAFNPNPAALQHTPERGYDLVAGDIIQMVRGEQLCASGKVLCVNLDNSTLTFKDMPHCVGKEVAVIQGSKQEFWQEHVVSRSGILLTGVCLPYKLQMDFNKLVQSSFIRSPDVTPPHTPRHLPPPKASHPDQPTAMLQLWDAPSESVLLELNRQQDLSSASQDPWSINEADKEDLRLHPVNASSSSSLADSLTNTLHDTCITNLCCNWHMKFCVVKTLPATWFNNFMDQLMDTVAPDPFVLYNSLVKHSKIAIRYSSRMKNTGMKVDTIPLEFLAPESLTGKNKKFTLI
ncbi:hypothetical protein BDR03DRAFT_1014393 [Suillus americanus]|nr:hypothetical protein BDR03DRAFT_1014393 [Suillus americanus]